MTPRKDEEIVFTPRAFYALMMIVIGGSGANLAYTRYSTEPGAVRPDPYTHSMAQADLKRVRDEAQYERDIIMRRLDQQRADIDECMRAIHGNYGGHGNGNNGSGG